MPFRMEKGAGRRVSRGRAQPEQDAEELAHWLAMPPALRVEAAAFMTRRLYRMRFGRELPPLDKAAGARFPKTHA